MAEARSFVAYGLYVFGLLWSFGFVVKASLALVDHSFISAAFLLAAAIGSWWLIAGAGRRLGLPPQRFFDALRHAITH